MNLVYPKMPGSGEAPLSSFYAFEKYDGTNIHWVWDATLGWYAFVRVVTALIWMKRESQSLMRLIR